MITYDARCTGCRACAQRCPKSCIKAKMYELGFEYPEIDESACIHCGLCSNVCPIERKLTPPTIQKAYAVVHKNSEVLHESTSGGMFSAVADWVLRRNGIVYGCAFDETLHAKMIRVDDSTVLYRLRGSKYVQCDTGESFALVEKDLEAGRTVFFTGTPCQIDGLKCFLKKNYDNLLSADLICHGVPSLQYFLDYIAYLEKKVDGRVENLNFRSKQNNGWSLAGTYEYISNKTKQKKRKRLFYYNSYYYSYFLSGYIYRESCYTCKYANLNRVGDFTLGDLWGVEGMGVPFYTDNGCSLVIVNSKKAQSILDAVDIMCYEISVEDAVKNNTQLQKPSVRSEKRTELELEYNKNTAAAISKNFRKQNYKSKLLGFIKYAIPKNLRRSLLKLRYKRS